MIEGDNFGNMKWALMLMAPALDRECPKTSLTEILKAGEGSRREAVERGGSQNPCSVGEALLAVMKTSMSWSHLDNVVYRLSSREIE